MLWHIMISCKRALVGAVLSVLVLGCFNGTHDFTIRFDDVQGLKKGDPVYFQASRIGKVETVRYTDAGRFRVAVAIDKEFSTAATDASRFYIDRDTEDPGRRRIRIVQLEPGGRPIEEGAVVEGRTKYAVLYEQFAHQIGKNITVLESGINAFLNDLQGFSSEEQIAEFEKQLDAILADLGHMSREMQYRLEHEILPLLRDKLEELRRRLEGSGQEEALEPLERKMDAIDDRLRV
jgi:ABC-type transporter Mla subunit MlaD